MEYLLINTKIILAFILLIPLPGYLLILILREDLTDLDIYERFSYSLILGMVLWIPITIVSFELSLASQYPIYLSILFTVILICLAFNKCNINFKNLHPLRWIYLSCTNIYIIIVIIQSLLIGWTAQFQAGNTDALTHLAGIRNIATSKIISNSDWILGGNMPIQNTYGNNPWYLQLAMISKISNVDVVFTYTTITSVIYFFSVLAIYHLFKTISKNAIISKFGSLIFTLVSLIIWIKDNDYTMFNINSHWIIFPQAIVSFVLFPIMFASFIRYILVGKNIFIILTLTSIIVLTRFHPNWLFWAPIVISGVIIFWKIVNKISFISYRNIILIYSICFFSALTFFISKNTYSFDINLISPIALWRNSGGNLLYISDTIYLYNPISYLNHRGYFDIITCLMLYYLHLKGVKNSKELLIIFIGFLIVIFMIIFNPLAVVPLVKIFGSPIPLYRVFELMWPTLSVFSIYSVLAIIHLKSKAYPALPSIALIVMAIFFLGYFGKNASFLMGVYENRGGYYSTNNSPYSEPFNTLRTLEPGRVAVRTPMANPIASFTNLDPITTEKWRYRTLADFEVCERDNTSILSFDKPYEYLVKIINKYNIRYIIINNSDSAAIDNLNKYPNFLRFRANAGDYQIWEID